ncbi:hypothetical protein A2U01_0038716, partial [Trifolium medium]|nr:hypothetical protein [Trifolium medium]
VGTAAENRKIEVVLRVSVGKQKQEYYGDNAKELVVK